METGRMVVVNRGRVRGRSHSRADAPGGSSERGSARCGCVPNNSPTSCARRGSKVFRTSGAVASDSRPMRPGRSAFAARRSSSMRAFRSSGGNCGGRDARLRASRSRAAPIHSAFAPENQSPFLRHRRGTKPHGARGAHRNRNAAGAHGLREGHLAQPGMHIEGGHRISTALIAIPVLQRQNPYVPT